MQGGSENLSQGISLISKRHNEFERSAVVGPKTSFPSDLYHDSTALQLRRISVRSTGSSFLSVLRSILQSFFFRGDYNYNIILLPAY